MSATATESPVFCQRLTLDRDSRQLWFTDSAVELSGHAFRLADALFLKPGEFLPKAAIRHAIWPDGQTPKGELGDNIRQVVFELRVALEAVGARDALRTGPKSTGSYAIQILAASPQSAPAAGLSEAACFSLELDRYANVWVWCRSALEARHAPLVLRRIEGGVRYIFRFGVQDLGRAVDLLLRLLLGIQPQGGDAEYAHLVRNAGLLVRGLRLEIDKERAPESYVSLLQTLDRAQEGVYHLVAPDLLVRSAIAEDAGAFRDYLEGTRGTVRTHGLVTVAQALGDTDVVTRLREQLARAVRLPPEDSLFDGLFATAPAAPKPLPVNPASDRRTGTGE